MGFNSAFKGLKSFQELFCNKMMFLYVKASYLMSATLHVPPTSAHSSWLYHKEQKLRSFFL